MNIIEKKEQTMAPIERWDEHLFWVQHSGSELNLLLEDFNNNLFLSTETKEETGEIRREYRRKKEGILYIL